MATIIKICVGAYRVSFARLQSAPESLFFGETDVTERQTNLAYRIVSSETVVVKNLQVQRSTHQLVVRESCSSSIKTAMTFTTINTTIQYSLERKKCQWHRSHFTDNYGKAR